MEKLIFKVQDSTNIFRHKFEKKSSRTCTILIKSQELKIVVIKMALDKEYDSNAKQNRLNI